MKEVRGPFKYDLALIAALQVPGKGKGFPFGRYILLQSGANEGIEVTKVTKEVDEGHWKIEEAGTYPTVD